MSTPSAKAPRTRRRTGTYAAADARRDAIIAAATECFAQSGYLNSSLAQIAADAGTSATVVLHHFGSKDKLLMEVLLRREQRTLRRMSELQEAGLLDSLPELLAASQEQHDYNLAHPGLLQLFIKLSVEAGRPDHPAHEYFVQRYAGAVTLVAGVLERAIAGGSVDSDTDVRQVAREILAVSDGLQVQWALAEPGHPLDLQSAFDSYFARLGRALAPAA